VFVPQSSASSKKNKEEKNEKTKGKMAGGLS
jgi:hypothetical protein